MDWAICMALWDHHYSTVQEENAHLRNGKFRRMHLLTSCSNNNYGGGTVQTSRHTPVLFVCFKG